MIGAFAPVAQIQLARVIALHTVIPFHFHALLQNDTRLEEQILHHALTDGECLGDLRCLHAPDVVEHCCLPVTPGQQCQLAPQERHVLRGILGPDLFTGGFDQLALLPARFAFGPLAVHIPRHAPHEAIERPFLTQIGRGFQHGKQHILGEILRVLHGGRSGDAPCADGTGHPGNAFLMGHRYLRWDLYDVVR